MHEHKVNSEGSYEPQRTTPSELCEPTKDDIFDAKVGPLKRHVRSHCGSHRKLCVLWHADIALALHFRSMY